MSLTPSNMLSLGTSMPSFELPTAEGKPVSSKDFADRPTVAAFICNHCPFVVHIAPSFSAFAKECAARGVNVVAINSNDIENYPDDSPEKMIEFGKKHDFSFPYLFDATQHVARSFDAACTPDFYLFGGNGRLFYRGRYDASRPGNSVATSGSDLKGALSALEKDEPAPKEQHPSMGCNIKWRT